MRSYRDLWAAITVKNPFTIILKLNTQFYILTFNFKINISNCKINSLFLKLSKWFWRWWLPMPLVCIFLITFSYIKPFIIFLTVIRCSTDPIPLYLMTWIRHVVHILQSIFRISQSSGFTEPTSQSIRLPDTTSQYIGLPKNISHSQELPKKYFYFSHTLTKVRIIIIIISLTSTFLQD